MSSNCANLSPSGSVPRQTNQHAFDTTGRLRFRLDDPLRHSINSFSHCIKLTFDKLLPAQCPPEAEVHHLISSGAGLQDTFKKLHPEPGSLNEEQWTATNKGVAAVVTALENHGRGGVVPNDLFVGDKAPGATRKPDPTSYVNVLLPALKGAWVGDTTADIKFARNIGAKSVWCRYGYGDKSLCEGLQPDFIVNSLNEVVGIL
ncbi:hypothetical protein BJ170DRAFT_705493 [Xylariales sp. AK1849]|nr:hypothetical protein BJ170DRAFT_705493 [Xylariales sp. AK1849]